MYFLMPSFTINQLVIDASERERENPIKQTILIRKLSIYYDIFIGYGIKETD